MAKGLMKDFELRLRAVEKRVNKLRDKFEKLKITTGE